MPFLLLFVPFLVVLALIVLPPIALVQRYRVGTARRAARRWVATVNAVSIGISAAMFVAGAAITNLWIPQALVFTLAGLGTGAVLGLLGLALTRWERSAATLHFTPNRWLVLAITAIVSARLIYGFWRSWQMWQAGVHGVAWAAASGVAGSLAAGAIVLGYYFTYWVGVRRRLARLPAAP